MTQTISQVKCCDNMEYMAQFPDKFFDLAIIDPPYGIGAENHAGKAENGWRQWDKKSWDKAIPTKNYFEQLFRISKNQIIWGGNYMTQYLHPSMGWIIWDKGQRNFSLADGEMAWTSFNRAMRIWEYARAKTISEHKIHPTQKPIDLYRWLLKKYANKGDKILDTHLGSQSSRIAANMEGFDFYGCELDAEYFEKGCNRYNEHISQQVLF